MKITVLTMWLNEEFLAPFFLRHYQWADEIHVILDSDTTDLTESIIRANPKVTVSFISFAEGFDNQIKADTFNSYARQSGADWLVVVDSDEFIFPPAYGDPLVQLLDTSADLVFARMWQVYRATGEVPLSPEIPPLFQRRHGDPNRTRGKNALYTKPCIYRPVAGVELSAGQHFFRAPVGTRISRFQFYGVHWSFADADQAVHRQILNGKLRISQADMSRNFNIHLASVTEDDIRRTSLRMQNSPLILRPQWMMILISWLNQLFILMLFRGRSWSVSNSSAWYNGRQPDILDVWADRHVYAARLYGAMKKLLFR